MSNVVDIDSVRPHITTNIECKRCGHKWIAVFPENANSLECSGCHKPVNAYGTAVDNYVCKTCGRSFSLCPPGSPEDWQHCLADDCESYDPSRDPSSFFED